MQQKAEKLLSVIIPTYKQAETIVGDVKNIQRILDQVHYNYEIIVVVDGIKEDNTYDKIKTLKSKKILVLGYEHNHGKGYAVRYGMARAKGEIIAFIDAGGDLNPTGISLMLNTMEWNNADIVVGSKLHPDSKVNYPNSRRILSFFSQLWVWMLFGLHVKDTQTGMKLYKREVLEKVLPRLLIKEFAFDVEILAVAKHLGYKKKYESPVELNYNFQSSIMTKSFLYILFRTLIDTLAIFYRLNILRYYDDKNHRRWRFDHELNFKVNVG